MKLKLISTIFLVLLSLTLTIQIAKLNKDLKIAKFEPVEMLMEIAGKEELIFTGSMLVNYLAKPFAQGSIIFRDIEIKKETETKAILQDLDTSQNDAQKYLDASQDKYKSLKYERFELIEYHSNSKKKTEPTIKLMAQKSFDAPDFNYVIRFRPEALAILRRQWFRQKFNFQVANHLIYRKALETVTNPVLTKGMLFSFEKTLLSLDHMDVKALNDKVKNVKGNNEVKDLISQAASDKKAQEHPSIKTITELKKVNDKIRTNENVLETFKPAEPALHTGKPEYYKQELAGIVSELKEELNEVKDAKQDMLPTKLSYDSQKTLFKIDLNQQIEKLKKSGKFEAFKQEFNKKRVLIQYLKEQIKSFEYLRDSTTLESAKAKISEANKNLEDLYKSRDKLKIQLEQDKAKEIEMGTRPKIE